MSYNWPLKAAIRYSSITRMRLHAAAGDTAERTTGGAARRAANADTIGRGSFVERAVELFLVHLGLVGTAGDEANECKGKLVDACFNHAEDSAERCGDRSSGEDAFLSDDRLEEVLVDLDELWIRQFEVSRGTCGGLAG